MACYNEGIMKRSHKNACVGGIVAFFYESRNYNVPVIACFNLSEKLVEDELGPKNLGGIVAKDNKDSYKNIAYIYGCYSRAEKLFGDSMSGAEIDNSSCLYLDSENKNTKEQADLLNAGINAWNTKTDVVNGDTSHNFYCNYHIEVGQTHLVVVEGVRTVSVE